MARLVDYLTLPGTGFLRQVGVLPPKPSFAPPPPPPAPAPVPTMVDAASSRIAQDARSRANLQRGVAGSVRNVGGARGRGLDVADTARALKALTGQ